MRIASVKINNPNLPGTSVIINAFDKQDDHELWSDQDWTWQPDANGDLVEVLPDTPASKAFIVSKPAPIATKKPIAGDK